MAIHVSTERFIEKIDDLMNLERHFRTGYDIMHDRVYLEIHRQNDRVVIYVSPVLCNLPDMEHLAFTRELKRILPEPEPELGRWW